MKLPIDKLKGLIPKRGGKGDVAPDDDEIDDHLQPTFFQRHKAWVAVAGGYAAVLLIVLATIFYLWLAEDAILAELDAMKAKVTITEFTAVEPSKSAAGPSTSRPAAKTAEAAGEPDPAETANPDAAETSSPPPAPPDTASDPLAEHPDPDLVEETSVGPLPKIGPSGRKPWRVYSKPHNPLERRPQIAVVVSGLGVSKAVTEDAIDLHGAVSLAFAPYSRNLEVWIDEARRNGHEVLLTLPMEPRDYPRSDAGPYALMTSLEKEQNLQRLQWVLSRATGYIGVTNYQGSAFTSDHQALQPIMMALADRGLAYLDTRENATSEAPEVAQLAGVPSIQADMVADTERSRMGILQSLTEAELLAKAQGNAVVVLHAYPAAIDRIRSWLETLPEKGLVLSPVSAVIEARGK